MKRKKLRKVIIILNIITIFIWMELYANDLNITNLSLVDQNISDHFMYIQVDVTWDNSWRTDEGPSNWDAAWIFAKWKLSSESDWKHCTFSTIDAEHVSPPGAEIDASFTKDNTGKGIIIYRSDVGYGTNNWGDVKLRWNYGLDGIADDATLDVKVSGIEMVYVPEGVLNLNTVASGNMDNEFLIDATYQYPTTQISSENPIPEGNIRWIGDGYSALFGGTGNFNGISYGSDSLCADYPKGYSPFYCMKYAVSQVEYVDFLNSLTEEQAGNRYFYGGSYQNMRYTIFGDWPEYYADRPDRACNWLSLEDGYAYADWTGLRPMTELEYEKACRGDQPLVTDEFAWGNTTIVPATTINNGVTGPEDGTEIITNTGANCCYGDQHFNGGDRSFGPLRGGIFATASSDRESSGGSYYGIMDLSGNLRERCVSVADKDQNGDITNSGQYIGSHGNGILTSEGFADESNWPLYGTGYRGGSWSYTEECLRVSARWRAGCTSIDLRWHLCGFRAVRTQ